MAHVCNAHTSVKNVTSFHGPVIAYVNVNSRIAYLLALTAYSV